MSHRQTKESRANNTVTTNEDTAHIRTSEFNFAEGQYGRPHHVTIATSSRYGHADAFRLSRSW